MRHHEANEPDETGEGNGRGGGEGGERHSDAAFAAHIDAEVRCRLVTKQESRECTTATSEEERGEGDWECGGGESWPGDTVETAK